MPIIKDSYLRATTAYGIERVDLIDYPHADIIPFGEFCDQLNSLEGGCEIFTFATPDLIDGLDREYGVSG